MKKITFVFIAVLTVLLFGCPEPESYYVVYNGNENTSGTAPTDSKVYQEGDIITVLDNSGNLVKTGVKFSGWNTKPDGTGTDQAAGSAFTLGNANVLLYAKWVDYVVGDTGPAGGIIFYDDTIGFDFDDSGVIEVDEKKFMTTDRYLEAAPSDQNGGAAIAWSDNASDATGATDQTLGSGETNTHTIMTGSATPTSGAVYLCDDLSEGGYRDWFLPSLTELVVMYEKRGVIGNFVEASGERYWSSSEAGATTARNHDFDSDGGQSSNMKSIIPAVPIRVRAIRAF